MFKIRTKIFKSPASTSLHGTAYGHGDPTFFYIFKYKNTYISKGFGYFNLNFLYKF